MSEAKHVAALTFSSGWTAEVIEVPGEGFYGMLFDESDGPIAGARLMLETDMMPTAEDVRYGLELVGGAAKREVK